MNRPLGAALSKMVITFAMKMLYLRLLPLYTLPGHLERDMMSIWLLFRLRQVQMPVKGNLARAQVDRRGAIAVRSTSLWLLGSSILLIGLHSLLPGPLAA